MAVFRVIDCGPLSGAQPTILNTQPSGECRANPVLTTMLCKREDAIMAATLLLWVPHGQTNSSGFSDRWLRAGHASLVLSYKRGEFKKDVANRVATKLATITWFPGELGDSKQLGAVSGMGASSSVQAFVGNPEQFGSSSGSGVGHIPAAQGMNQLNVLQELINNGTNGAARIEEIEQDRQNNPYAWNGDKADQLRLQQKRYPRLQEWNSRQRNNPWIDNFITQQRNQVNHEDQVSVNNYQELLNTRIKPPDKQAVIPTMADDNVVVGLNDVAMMLWWNDFAAQKKTYHLLFRNCSMVCASALIAGGALAFVPSPVWKVWEPKIVHDWAEQVAKKIGDMNTKFGQIRQRIVNRTEDQGYGTHDVWDVSTWKEKSSVRFAHRYGDLTDIDKLLDSYHKDSKTRSGDGDAVLRNNMIQYLAGIVFKIDKILTDRAQTKRKMALVALGKQSIREIENLKKEAVREMMSIRDRAKLSNQYLKLLYKFKESYGTEVKSIRDAFEALIKATGDDSVSVAACEEMGHSLKQLRELSYLIGKEPTYLPKNQKYTAIWQGNNAPMQLGVKNRSRNRHH